MGREFTLDQRRLLVLGGGPAQLGVLEAAREKGLWIAVCDRDPSAPGFAFADQRCIVATSDEPAVERLAGALSLDGVISPGSDRSVAIAARVAEKLGLAHPLGPAVALAATNKLRRRQALASADVPQPQWHVVGAGDAVEIPLPVVTKAPDRSGRKGLSLITRADDLGGAIARARSASRANAVLVEEYVEGPEVGVTGFAIDGAFIPLLVTDRIDAHPGLGAPLDVRWPSEHAGPAIAVARRAVEALRIAEGPTSVRLRISESGPRVVEVAARLAGGHEADLVRLITGIDLNGLALAAALGERIEPADVRPVARAPVGGAVARFLVAPPGRCDGIEVPAGLQGVASVSVFRDPGHVFGEYRRASDAAGCLIAVGDSNRDAVERATAATERIRFAMADVEAFV